MSNMQSCSVHLDQKIFAKVNSVCQNNGFSSVEDALQEFCTHIFFTGEVPIEAPTTDWPDTERLTARSCRVGIREDYA